MFGLSEILEDDKEMGTVRGSGFPMLTREVAALLDLDVEHSKVQSTAYTLWAFVHGHSFIVIDKKNEVTSASSNERALLEWMTALYFDTPDRDEACL